MCRNSSNGKDIFGASAGTSFDTSARAGWSGYAGIVSP
jgi:hypothetical protein